VTVTTFGILHNVDDGFTTSEAFWMTICSTVVSTITNFTLIWDFVKTPNFSKAGKSVFTCLQFVYSSSSRQRDHTQTTISRHHYNDLPDLYSTWGLNYFSHDESHLRQWPILLHRHHTHHRLRRHRADNCSPALHSLSLCCIRHHHSQRCNTPHV
jgi:hypothetical protein